MSVCSHCQGWRRHPQDRFCGRCGTSFLVLTATAWPRCSFVGETVPDAVTVALRSVGPINPTGTRVVLRDGRTGAELSGGVIKEDELVCEGDSSCMLLPLPPEAREGRWRGEIVHIITGSREQTRILCPLEYGLPTPVLALAENTIAPIPKDDGSAAALLSLTLVDGELAPLAQVDVKVQDQDGDIPPIIVQSPSSSDGGLVRDGRLDVPLQLPAALAQRLHLNPTGVSATLEILLADGWEGRRSATRLNLPFVLRFRSPAFPQLVALPDRLVALAGRTAHLTATLENNGGTACAFAAVSARAAIDGGQTVTAGSRLSGPAAVLDPGARMTLHLPIPLSDGAMSCPPGVYNCDVEIAFAGHELFPLRRNIILEIRSPQVFDGYIAIDFGTTESAVAFMRHDGSGIPSLLTLTPDGPFIPTSIAYYLEDGEPQARVCIGREARARGEAGGRVLFLDTIKWRIERSESVTLPDGRVVSWVEIAADYLRGLKRMIEEHPDIAALVDAVYVTRPARFGSPATASLLRAFQRAGMTPMEVSVGEGHDAILSESWSPLVLALPLPHLAPLQREALDQCDLLGPPGAAGVHRVMTYDVGGGSTDLSLFRVEVKDRATISVVEIATEGTTDRGTGAQRPGDRGGAGGELCGNRIAALLCDHLIPSLDRWLARRGITRNRVPFHLPWEPMPAGGISAHQAANGRALAGLLWSLQNGQDGPFLDLVDAFGKTHSTMALLEPNRPDVRTWLAGYQTQHLSRFQPAGAPLLLTMVDGTRLSIPWGVDGLCLDLPAFMDAFVSGMAQPMASLLDALLDADTNAGSNADTPLHVLLTGRGSLFPLVSRMLVTHLEERAADRFVLWRVDYGLLKSITSLGASFLTDVILNMPGVVFRSEASSLFGIVGDADPQTGHRRFLPLCRGVPRPEDGPIAVKRPFPPGNLERRVELGSASRPGDLETARFRREFVVSGRVALTVEEAANAHIVVEAPRDHCLTVAIACPPADAPEPVEWSAHRRAVLGSVALVAGACDAAKPEASE